MELGTGIFLSALMISVVMLYSVTKDRWRWRRFFKGTMYACLSLLLLGGLLGAGAYVYQQIPIPIGRQTEYAGLRLGMPMDDVLYIKGYPAAVLTHGDATGYFVLETSNLEKGKSA